MLVCNFDPLVPEFYVKHCALEKGTVKLKAKGVEYLGIEPAVKRKIMYTILVIHGLIVKKVFLI